jgi:hypothetical protein
VMNDDGLPMNYRIVDARTGRTVRTGTREPGTDVIDDDRLVPRIVIFCDEEGRGRTTPRR